MSTANAPEIGANRRQRRPRQEWEQEILRSARRTFAREGYDASINQLIEESGAPVGTFYRLFRDKDVLFARVMDDLRPGYLTALRETVEEGADPDDTCGRLRATIEALVTVGAGEYADMARLYFSDVRGLGPARAVARSVDSDEGALLVGALAAGVDAGTVHCEDIDLTAVAVLGAVRRVTEEYVSGRADPPVEQAAARTAGMLLDGLRSGMRQSGTTGTMEGQGDRG